MYASVKCTVAILAAICIGIIAVATFFEPRPLPGLRAITAWACVTLLLCAFAGWAASGLFRTLREVDFLGATILFETQIQPTDPNQQEVRFARKLVALSQRHSLPLSVIGIAWTTPPTGIPIADGGNLGRIAKHFDRFRYLKALDQGLRTSDAIFTMGHPSRCFIVCPYTAGEQAIGVCRRVKLILASTLTEGTKLTFAAAEYGTDGYALEELVTRCEARLSLSPMLPDREAFAEGRVDQVADAGRNAMAQVPGE